MDSGSSQTSTIDAFIDGCKQATHGLISVFIGTSDTKQYTPIHNSGMDEPADRSNEVVVENQQTVESPSATETGAAHSVQSDDGYRNKYKSALTHNRKLERGISELKRSLHETEWGLATEREERQKITLRCTTLENTLLTTDKNLQAYMGAYDRLHSEHEAMKARLQQYEQQEAQHQAAIAALKFENAQRALLIEQRYEEVQVAKEFLDSQDKLSGGDIVAKVRALNEQIFQVSAAIAESCEYHKPDAALSNTIDQVAQNIFDRLLPTMNHTENPELVQIALQARLVQLSLWIVSIWGNHPEPISKYLTALASSIRTEKVPLISRRWRSITHSHAMLLGGSVDEFIKSLTDECAKSLFEVLRSTGGTVDSSIKALLRPRISNLIRQMLDLQRIINQDVMSCDYVLFQEQEGAKFDFATMLDYELDGGGSKKKEAVPGTVACTIALGVLRIAQDRGDKGVEDRAILLKPGVVRDTYLISIKNAIEAEES